MSLLKPPIPVLPAHPAWIALYWRAWKLQGKAEEASGPDTAYAKIRRLQQQGDHNLAAAQTHTRLNKLVTELVATNKLVLTPIEAGEETSWPPPHWNEPAVLLISSIIGIEVLPVGNKVVWRLREKPPVGVRNLPLGPNIVSLVAEADEGGGIAVAVETPRPFWLDIETEFVHFSEQIPAGQTHLLLTHLDRTDVREV